jgi:hypothetical protein
MKVRCLDDEISGGCDEVTHVYNPKLLEMDKIYEADSCKEDAMLLYIKGIGKFMTNRFEEVKEEEPKKIEVPDVKMPDFSYITTNSTPFSNIVIWGQEIPYVELCHKCKKPGEYWGMRLAFPQPLCFECLKIEHLKEPLPLTKWERIKKFFYKALSWRKK